MKREDFVQPKEEMRPNPNNTPTVLFNPALNQAILVNGRLFYITDIEQSFSVNGVSTMTIRAMEPGTPFANPTPVLGWS